MNSRTLFSLSLTIFSIVCKIRPSSTSNDLYSSCSNQYGCGSITEIGYPFWGENRPEGCGYPSLKLACEKNLTTMNINGVKYQVLDVHQSDQTITISRFDFMNGLCPSKFVNTTLDYNLFDVNPNNFRNISLFYCTSWFNGAAGLFSCPQYDVGSIVVGVRGPVYGGVTCNATVVIPISRPTDNMIYDMGKVEAAIMQGFDVRLKVETEKCTECVNSKGVCGYYWVLNRTICNCSDQSISYTGGCPSSPAGAGGPGPSSSEAQKKNQKPLKIGLAIGAVFLLAIFVACWSFYIKQRKKYVLQSKDLSTPPSSKENNNNNVSTTLITTNLSLTRSIPPYPSSTLSLQNRSSYFGAQVFSYMDLQKATDNFHPSRELGNGGYGTVYYGKLDDGREVAVKCLYENNFKRVEQFMNEVEILTRLQDRNLVKLYGCTSRHGQELLLVYEYIPNGTVADHIHGNKRTNPGPLTWPVRLNIAVETAHALAYLHRSDIIHRDVKTSNILLDNKFHVKVADFGLCRLFPLDVSHVSTAPQGTPGYVDPEYYQCYQLTDRSDVFSFGVVLIELISSLQAVDTSRHRHDINLANMAVNKIQNHALDELVDPSLGFDRDYGVRQMVTSVAELAFRCLQQNREMRPSMEEVVDVLRRIGDEKLGAEKAEVVDVGADDVGLLKHMLPPLSPVSVVNDNGFS